MFKNILGKLFGPEKENKEEKGQILLVASLPEKIMPADRGLVYARPLDDFLQLNEHGEVSGGGTMQLENGEVAYCDIEIQLYASKPNYTLINEIVQILEDLGAPKGSTLLIESTNETIPFGKKEGLAIYLDGANLPDEVYETSDSNYVFEQLKKLTKDTSSAMRYWEGPDETAFYFYSDSFTEMKATIQDFINAYPLCEGARIEQIA